MKTKIRDRCEVQYTTVDNSRPLVRFIEDLAGTLVKHLRLPHSSRFFVEELQIFGMVQIGLKFVRTSACRTLADFLSRLTAFELRAESLSAMLEKTLVHVTIMTIPHWLRYARAPTNCLGPPQTSRQGPTRRFEI